VLDMRIHAQSHEVSTLEGCTAMLRKPTIWERRRRNCATAVTPIPT
jgi:hypothetical protein